MKHESIWNEYKDDKNKLNSLKKDIKVKVLIVGAGITGILCANELKNRGIDYIVVEKDTIASKTSKDTTAFLSIFHDILYHDLIKSKGLDKAKDYFKFNQDAIESYYKLSLQYDFDFKRCSSIIYTNKDVDKINNEKEALDKIGVSSEFIDKLPINLPFTLGLKVDNQATINPVKLILQLSKELNIFENTCIHKIKNSIAYTTNGQRIIFNKVI